MEQETQSRPPLVFDPIDPMRWAQEALGSFDRSRLSNVDGTVNVEAYRELDWLTHYLDTARRKALIALQQRRLTELD